MLEHDLTRPAPVNLMKFIEVVDYDPAWPTVFAELREHVLTAVSETAVAVEHVGSTAVPGLAAKPVIDMQVVVRDAAGVATAIRQLATLGYEHRGDLGIEGREAFRRPKGSPPHHLYVCQREAFPLRNHIAVRDYLRSNAEAAAAYGSLKKQLARQHPHDIDAYIDGKTDFLLAILAECGLAENDLKSTARINQGGN